MSEPKVKIFCALWDTTQVMIKQIAAVEIIGSKLIIFFVILLKYLFNIKPSTMGIKMTLIILLNIIKTSEDFFQ